PEPAPEPLSAPVIPADKPKKRLGAQIKGEDIAGPFFMTGLEVIGYERIRAVRFQFRESGITSVGGPNDQGKTSLAHSIMAMLGGLKFVSQFPVNREAEQAEIVGVIESRADGTRYVVEL